MRSRKARVTSTGDTARVRIRRSRPVADLKGRSVPSTAPPLDGRGPSFGARAEGKIPSLQAHRIPRTSPDPLSARHFKKAANQRLEDLSIHDGLTGLHNYREFRRRLAAEVERALRYDRPLSLLLFDIDHFKAVNDTFGHLA